MRIIALLFLIAIGLLVFSKTLSSEPHGLSPVAYVYSEDGHGSGVFIAPDVVITARHVVDEGEFKVRDETGGIYTIRSIVMSKDGNDFAILYLDKPAPVAPAAVDCSMPTVLTQLTVIGYPLDLQPQTRFVRVSGYGALDGVGVEGVEDGMPVIWTDGTVIPGDSGGGVFSKKGVIAIMNGIMNNPFGGASGLDFLFPLAKEPLVCGASLED